MFDPTLSHRGRFPAQPPRADRFDVARLVLAGLSASLLSSAILAWRGRAELDSAVAPNNAPSQYAHGQEALLLQRGVPGLAEA